MRYVIRERFFHLGEDSDITDDQGHPVYHVDGKVLTLHNTLLVRDLAGNEVAKVERQLIALRPTYHITRQGQELAEVHKKLFSPFVDRFSIDVAGPQPYEMSLTGSLLEHEYTIARNNQTVATVSKRWISLTNTYGVDIAAGEDDLLILASVLALDLAEDREDQEQHSEH